ncbi:MAG: acyloxyacyl hydrolase [Hyphomicrobiales bacterium]|nr:acyloxyacyl hydrolase [Hyphomicrobiales bacterium]
MAIFNRASEHVTSRFSSLRRAPTGASLARFAWAWLLTLGFLANSEGFGFAADLHPSPPPDFGQTASALAGFEFRAGVFGSTWGPERGELNLNGEVLFPKFLKVESWADILIPRLQIGATGSVGGGTSYAYVGPIWTAAYERLFVDLSLGGAIHNGETGNVTDPSRNKLGGCRVIYHVGSDIGYRLTDNWSAMLTFDHISNGSGTLSSCGQNQGVTIVGVRLGYTF